MKYLKPGLLILALQLLLFYIPWALFIFNSHDCTFNGPIGYDCQTSNPLWIAMFCYVVLPPVAAKLILGLLKKHFSWIKIIALHIAMIVLTFIVLIAYVRETTHVRVDGYCGYSPQFHSTVCED